MEDVLEGSADVCNWKRELGRNKPTDFEMLKTYATGLLAMSLAGCVVCVLFFISFYFLLVSTFYFKLLHVNLTSSMVVWTGVPRLWKIS